MSSYTRLDAAVEEDERSPAEIEHEIERTRDRLSTNLEELSGRLDPRRLKRRAKDALVERTLDSLTVVLQTIRRNPLPAAAVVLSVLSLLAHRHDRRRSAARRLARAAASA